MKTTNVLSPFDIPGELLKKYYQSGPRYTSYPTAPQFSENFDKKKIIKRWKNTNQEKKGISLYVHIPFCKKRCLYCGCYTETGHNKDVHLYYIQSLKKEMKRILSLINPERKIEQMALGGGTPTTLSSNHLSQLINNIFKSFKLAKDAEMSIEIDPRGVDTQYLARLIQMGFNRFSFGVQDLNSQVQKNINRILALEKLEKLMHFLKRKGFNAINIDLIYGLPGQKVGTFCKTIEKIIKLKPSRIALFGYAHVPWVSKNQKVLEKYKLPDPKERIKLFGTAFKQLVASGYKYVGMDHFALPEDELISALNKRTLTRNFMGYTTRRGLDLIGIGASSISSVDGSYTQNIKDIKNYIQSADTSTWIKGFILTPEDELRREIIIDLFCNFYLDISYIEKTFNIDFKNHFAHELDSLKEFKDTGLLDMNEGELMVTGLGRFFIRNICMRFDQYLTRINPEKQYSKTI